MYTMKKNYLATLALVFCASLCAAQTEKQESKAVNSDKQQKVISDEKSSDIITAQNKSSKRTKIAPEVFYVVDDKAVDYKTYLQHLQKTKNQH